jgi:outer membrane receptor protein involved in Fe transport
LRRLRLSTDAQAQSRALSSEGTMGIAIPKIAACGGLLILIPVAALPAAADTPAPAIETVVVQGQKLNIETKIDRKIYSVPEDAQSTLGTLSDILSVIPSVDVDPDGLVSLRGDTNVLILIDGKPATQLQGSKAGDNLQSISARDIERIEILTIPPAQFKAEGTAGVINIITRKRSAKETAHGSLQGSLGDGGRWLVGGNGSYRGKNFTTSLSAGYRADYRGRTIQSQVVGPDPTTGQVLASRDYASQRIRRNVPSVDFSTEYDPSERQSLSASASWLHRGGLRTYTQFDDSTLESGAVTASTRRLTSGHDPENDYNTTLRFTQKFSKPEETLDLSVHRSMSHQHEHYDYVNDSFVPPAPTLYNNLSFTEDHGVTEADADYTLPLSKAQSLKFGYAFEQDDYGFDNVGANVDPLTGLQTIDPALSTDFKFHQRIHAIYLSFQATANAWTWLAGIRTEWTTTDALQLTTNLSTATGYADVYPSLHVDRSVSDRSTLFFGASRRVTRPEPSYLNPYVDHEYPPNLNAGNPKLRPQFTQSFDLGYGYEGQGASYSLTGYYRRNKDSVTDVTEYLGQGMTLTTKTNLPRSDSAGLEFSATGHIVPQLSYSLSGNAFYTQFDATALGVPGLKSTTGINAKAKLDFRPTADDSAQLTFLHTDKRLTPQGSVSAINIVNLGYKHALSSALSAVATISDLFDGQRYQRFAATPTVTQVYERSVAGPIAFVGLMYTIGVAKTEKQPTFDYQPGE